MIYALSQTLLIIISFQIIVAKEDYLELRQLSTGTVLGRKLQTTQNTTAFLFLGVPYGEAPKGNLRYRAPVPKKAWKEIINVQNYRAACLQNTSGGGAIPFSAEMLSEDCLLLNIFTSENCLRQTKRCSVIYYIHGGGYNYDAPIMFDAEFLANNFPSKDVLLVTVTYRLGSFGFFNLGSMTNAEKNVGMLDIVEGLRWVQREIDVFGGDKNRVTIMGHSSGAGAVELLSLLPSTVGLFQQIVIMSGAIDETTITKEKNILSSRALAMKAGCANRFSWTNSRRLEKVIACLQRKDGNELLSLQRALEDENMMFAGPAMEEDGGLIADDFSLIKQKRVPYRCLTGTTKQEFVPLSPIKFFQNGVLNRQLLIEACKSIAKDRGFHFVEEVGMACAEDYAKRPENADDLMDDSMFFLPLFERGEELRSRGAQVFKYSFDYEHNGSAILLGNPVPLMHAFDLLYVMGLHMGNFTQEDETVRQIYSSAFVNFAKTGDPSMTNGEKWQPTDERNNYFKIDFDANFQMTGNLDGYHADAVNFWFNTAKRLESDLMANKTGKNILVKNAHAANLPGSNIQYYVPAFTVLFLCVVFGVAQFYKSKQNQQKIVSEKTKLNLTAVKLYH